MTNRTSGELHYPGRTNPRTGALLGPDLRGRHWQITGAIYDPERDQTTVYADVWQSGAVQ